LNRFVLAAWAVLSVFLVGCSTTSSPVQYKASTKNVVAIEDYVREAGAKVKTADFVSAPGVEGSPWCRANGPVSFGSGKTAAQFIQEALQEELFLAKAYASSAPISIGGTVEKLTFSSVSPASWEIGLTLTSSNGQILRVENSHRFDTSWDAWSACKNVADAFAPAVQGTLAKAVTDPRFKLLLIPK
jgi:hypothetical protein